MSNVRSPFQGMLRRFQHQRAWRKRFEQARVELESYSDRELEADLRISRSDIASIAAETADQQVGPLDRVH